MARALTDKSKLVFSQTLEDFSWRNSAVIKLANPDLINRYREAGSGDLLTIGSPGLVASLTQQDLVDDYYFSVQPVIAGGGGVRLFDKLQLDARKPLTYLGSTPLGSGVVINHYQRK